MKMTDSEKIGSQKYADARLFNQWCENFFDISFLIKEECQLDLHHCRWWHIAIWELFESGKPYVEDMLSVPENNDCIYLKNALQYIEKLQLLFSETDYFMLQYYRHSASHIFQHNYSLLNRKGDLNPEIRQFTFSDQTGVRYKLTYAQIIVKVKEVLEESGLYEPIYRKQLISRCFDTTNEWSTSQKRILANL